jgi:hypothetical protein
MKMGESGFYVGGLITEAELCELKNQGVKSHLYLCPDTGADIGILPAGFETCKQVSVWPLKNLAHVPFAMDDFAFTVSAASSSSSVTVHVYFVFCYIFRVNLIINSTRDPAIACSSLQQ